MRALANPQTPTHRSGRESEAMVRAARKYMPGGVLPSEADTNGDLERPEHCSVCTTEEPAICDHIARI